MQGTDAALSMQGTEAGLLQGRGMNRQAGCLEKCFSWPQVLLVGMVMVQMSSGVAGVLLGWVALALQGQVFQAADRKAKIPTTPSLP